MSRRAIIVGAGSDIGAALAAHWQQAGWEVVGTHRHTPAAVPSIACDMADVGSIDACAQALMAEGKAWDALVMCPATMEPIGAFAQVDIDAWEKSFTENFTRQLRLLHRLLPARSGNSPLVLFFAGGGTNDAPLNYSAYTVSKIAMIKAVELLDAEMPEVRLAILGPGWVETKIHGQTLAAGDAASAGAAAETARRQASGEFVPMAQVLAACDWLRDAPKALVGGRNFSAAHDFGDIVKLENSLKNDASMFKLRRAGNGALA